MDDADIGHLQRIVQVLQDYPVDIKRARQLSAELEAFRRLLRQDLPKLSFDDQPTDFRSAQVSRLQHV